MIENISFCIMCRAQDEQTLNRCINGILKQRVPRLEILVVGSRCDYDKIKLIKNDEWLENGELSRMRNLFCSDASGDFIVLMADNIELSDRWYEAIKIGDHFDIVGSRIVMEDNTRAIDWAYQVKIGSRGYPCPLDYDEWTTKAYVSGELMLLRKSTWERVKFDETLTRDHGDDMDFCLRASKAGFRIGVFPEAKAKYVGKILGSEADLTFEKSKNVVRTFRQAFAAGKEAFKSKDYGQALKHLTKAAETVADDPGTLSLIGWTHYFAGSYKQALQTFGEAINIDPSNHSAFRGRGWAFIQSGAHEKGVSDLSMALELVNPNHRDDWLETVRGLSWSNYHCGSYDEAIKHFRMLAEKAGSHERGLLQDTYRGLGWSCYRKAEFSEAAAYFNRAISNIDRDNHELLQDAKNGLRLVAAGSPSQGNSDEENKTASSGSTSL